MRRVVAATVGALALLLALAAPAPAEAQTSALVGNNLKADVPHHLDLDRDRAQAFTTGGVSEGYTLTSVQIGVATGGSPTGYSMKIVSAGASGPGANVIGTLTAPPSLTPGINNRFTGSVDLDASTTYYILLDLTASNAAVQLKGTQSVQENPGGAAGWSIGDSSRVRSVDDSGAWTGDHSLKVIIYGYSKAVPLLDSGEIAGAKLVLNFGNDLDTASGTAAGQFAIKAGGGAAQAATAISITGRQVVLTAPRVAPGEKVTVSYTKPGTRPLKGANQLEVAGFSDQAVTNNTRALVSNTGQAVGASIPDRNDHAQAFTTGSNASGYNLTSIAVRFLLRGTHTNWDLQLWSNSGTSPGSLLATLAKPTSVADGVNIFRASGTGIDLAARTTYWVVWNNHISPTPIRMYIVDTGSQAEDWGGAEGWSIADHGRVRPSLSTGSDWVFARIPMISINGYSKQARPPTFPSGGGGGGGGGGFGPGPGEVLLTVTAAIAGEEAPTGRRYGFAFECTPPDGAPATTWAFSLGPGQGAGRFVPGEIPCSLTVTDAGGADRVDGLFTDLALGEEDRRVVVTFTYGVVAPVPTDVSPESETVVEEDGVSLTIPAGSRDVPYAVLLETESEDCATALDLDGESLACHTVTVFDADGEEAEESIELLVPATIMITLDAAVVEELGGLEGVQAARERGELRMLRRAGPDSPWQELPFTVAQTDGAVLIVVSVSSFSDFTLIASEPRLRTMALHTGWNVVVWDGADGASIADALGDVTEQVDVIYEWGAAAQTWRSHRPGGPAILSAFDSFTRGATYWVRSSEAVDWTVVAGPLEPPAAEPTRLHSRWTEVVWRGADGVSITGALGEDVSPQVEVVYRWLAETQVWTSFRPGAPAFLSAFDTFQTGASYWIAVAEAIDWTVPLAPP